MWSPFPYSAPLEIFLKLFTFPISSQMECTSETLITWNGAILNNPLHIAENRLERHVLQTLSLDMGNTQWEDDPGTVIFSRVLTELSRHTQAFLCKVRVCQMTFPSDSITLALLPICPSGPTFRAHQRQVKSSPELQTGWHSYIALEALFHSF